MFLKSEPFEYNGVSVTLFELSALQRIEHLEYLKKLESIEDADMQKAVSMTVRTGALIVAMSLWHGHSTKGSQKSPAEDTLLIQQEVLSSWPLEAISAAEYQVKLLSGMVIPISDNQPEGGPTPEPVSVEKPSPVS
ncbi:TPA_asm: phage minor tail protein G [Salmonella enterica subsp. enterica serovar Java]|nr:phage minor tail protein G [Salmonella enterica subsp. enterica serovar Java]